MKKRFHCSHVFPSIEPLITSKTLMSTNQLAENVDEKFTKQKMGQKRNSLDQRQDEGRQ